MRAIDLPALLTKKRPSVSVELTIEEVIQSVDQGIGPL
jgi:hypothetical protein